MNTAVKLALAAIFAIYLLYWCSLAAFLGFGVAHDPSGTAKLFYDSDGAEGIAGPLFLWFLVIFNPITVILLWRRWGTRRAKAAKKEI